MRIFFDFLSLAKTLSVKKPISMMLSDLNKNFFISKYPNALYS